MRKLLWIVAAAICTSAAFTACSMDTDNEAEASVVYHGESDKIVFADSADIVYTDYINKVMETKQVPLTGVASVFTESARTDDGYVANAIALCHEKAIKTYDTAINGISSRQFRTALDATYGDSIDFDSLGTFTVNLSLYGMVGTEEQLVAKFAHQF